MGSFRPVAGKRHLHRYYSFAEQLQETAVKSLHHSCRSELHVNPWFPTAQTIRSPDQNDLRMSLSEYFRGVSADQGRRLMEQLRSIQGSHP